MKVCTCRGYLIVEVISDANGVVKVCTCRRDLIVEVISKAEGEGESMYMSRRSDF